MGTDESIVRAARVSTGSASKGREDDRRLIRYLMRHAHTSPFEQVEVTFHVRLPIFVARQWVRHRTACLSGDAVLYFDLPGALKRGRRRRHGMTIAKFYRLWTEGALHRTCKNKPLFLDRINPDAWYTIPELSRLVERREETLRNMARDGLLRAQRIATASPRQPSIMIPGSAWHEFAARTPLVRVPMRDRLSRMQLRSCDEDTGEIVPTHVVDVWPSGVKPVFEVTLANGYSLKMSKDHRCLTDRGWMTLEAATELRLMPDGSVTWSSTAPAFAVNGVAAHRDRDWLAARRAEGLGVASIADLAGVSYHTIRKYLRLYNLQFSSSERSRLSGRTQRGRRRLLKRPRVLSPAHLEAIRRARSGPASNFWKGGVTSERAAISSWAHRRAERVHYRHGHSCVICGERSHLQVHHLDPFWNNPARARDLSNLITLCRTCHSRVHTRNLEIAIMDAIDAGADLRNFWRDHHATARPARKRKPRVRKLLRTFSRIVNIRYVGEEMTYDLAVEGPWHNFVANGFIVHNSVNEHSARYSVLKDEFYVPDPGNIRAQDAYNRQGRAEPLPEPDAQSARDAIDRLHQAAYRIYTELLQMGVARELARLVLPVSIYTEWYWKIDLHNLFHFLRLRLDPHAQAEIREYAQAIAAIARDGWPLAWEAFSDYALGQIPLSRTEAEAIRLLGLQADPQRLLEACEQAHLAAGERRELAGKLRRIGILRG
jgi:thymidylate synthase (FAD)